MDKKILNRKIYKSVKKMDRQEMEKFLMDIYKEGFKDGVETGHNVEFKVELAEVLNKTKGVGEKTYDKIMATAREMEG